MADKTKYVCPFCGSENVYVAESRPRKGQDASEPVTMRRRRVCSDCSHRWTTVEVNIVDYDNLVRFKSKYRLDLTRITSEMYKLYKDMYGGRK